MTGAELSGTRFGMNEPSQQATNMNPLHDALPTTSTDSIQPSEGDEGTPAENDPRLTKRRLFDFSKKKKDDVKNEVTRMEDGTTGESNARRAAPSNLAFVPTTHPYIPQSPLTRNQHSSSPRVVSPAGSQIFERDVQEATAQVPNSPAIPAHIQTENHIPAVLDASSEAITDNALDPDTVEIVMHSSHQPAAMSVTGISSSEVAGMTWSEDLSAHPDKDDAASNYGALDSSDVRRLSFISFADVVQAEQTEHMNNRDPIHIAGLAALSSEHRSPSPIRSTVSSQGIGTSPPTSKSASIKGFDLSPTRSGRPLASPTLSIPSQSTGSELMIETMSQALRKTRSGDLTGTRSQPLSPMSTISSFEQRSP